MKYLVKPLFVSILLLASLSCEQYEYSSPLPGLLEVRLHVKNNRPQILPFGNGTSSFIINLRSLEARKGDVRLPIFANVNAIRRNPDGDFFNCLDTIQINARDSALILGQVYAPPETFTRLDLHIVPFPFVIFFNGFYLDNILVELPPQLITFHQLPEAGQSPLFMEVEEHRVTRVTVTFDLDSSLVRKAETFEYHPTFYVSSVQIF